MPSKGKWDKMQSGNLEVCDAARYSFFEMNMPCQPAELNIGPPGWCTARYCESKPYMTCCKPANSLTVARTHGGLVVCECMHIVPPVWPLSHMQVPEPVHDSLAEASLDT
jgi:hypothetical protein